MAGGSPPSSCVVSRARTFVVQKQLNALVSGFCTVLQGGILEHEPAIKSAGTLDTCSVRSSLISVLGNPIREMPRAFSQPESDGSVAAGLSLIAPPCWLYRNYPLNHVVKDMSWVRIPPTSCFRFFSGRRKKGNNVFASVRAGDVNGYDSLLLSTTVVRDEGREPRRSLLRSR